MNVEDMTVIEQKKIAKNIYSLVLQGELVRKMGTPGQFVQVKIGDGVSPLLRRPISIAHIDKGTEQMTLIYRVNGMGTSLLSRKQKGERVNIFGPLGNGFPLEGIGKGQRALIIGGGIGIPPLYELSKQLVAKGVEVVHVFGFQSKDSVFWYDEFSNLGETYVATVDGTVGTKGYVTEILDERPLSFHRIYSCGPIAMLKVLEEKYPKEDVYVSLEERMACGMGACYACARPVKGKKGEFKKVCTDGPVFRIGEVVL